MRQQILPLFNDNNKSCNLVLGESNQLAWQYLSEDKWASPICWLYGEQGSGKTMMLQNWQRRFNARYLDIFNLDFTQALQPHYYVIDDLPTLDSLHSSLFHLINAVKNAGAKLLLASNLMPVQYPTTLPDLASRLKAAHVLRLENPDDAMLKAVMFEHLRLKQLSISEAVIDYLLKRIPRNFADAISVIQMLDDYSLANRCEINITLARAIIDNL